LGEDARPAAYSRKRISTSSGSNRKTNPIILEQPVMDLPSLGHGQGLAVHGRRGRHQAQESELGDPGERDTTGFRFPPATRHAMMDVSGVATASQALTSGKLNEVIDLFAAEVDASTCGSNQRRIQAQPPPRAGWFGLCDSLLDACEDKLSGRATFTCSSLVEAAVQFPRHIDARTDRSRLHGKHSGSAT